MQYNIRINQLALSGEKNLDITDCAILDYLIWICLSQDSRVEKQRYKGYTWVNYKHLIQEMPLLRIKSTSSISVRINKLVKAKLIKTIRKKDNRLFVMLEPKIETLFIKPNSPIGSSEQGAVREDEHNSYTSSNSFTKKSNSIYNSEFFKKNSGVSLKKTERKKSTEKKSKSNNTTSLQSNKFKPSSLTKSPDPFNRKTPEGVYAEYVKHCINMGPRTVYDRTMQDCYGEKRLVQTETIVSGEHFADIVMAIMNEIIKLTPSNNTLPYVPEQWHAIEDMVENKEIGINGISMAISNVRHYQNYLELKDREDAESEDTLVFNEVGVNIPNIKTAVSIRNEFPKLLRYERKRLQVEENSY